MEIFSIQNLSFTYPQAQKQAVKEVSLTVQAGELITRCGNSGCGKSTLLRNLKPALSPHGKRDGVILFCGQPLDEIPPYEQASRIGYVLQQPDNQIVTDKVWHELAFGLESLGFGTEVIRSRVAEMASFFGIQDWFYRDVSELSGGQKQILNLASIMAMQPEVLILDEPTSQLDPIAATDFLETIQKINHELGITILLSEHRLEEVLPMSDRVLVLDQGRVIAQGTAQEVGSQLKREKNDMFLAMPAPMRIYAGVENDLQCPVTVKEGRKWLESLHLSPTKPTKEQEREILAKEAAVTVKNIWFRYEKQLPDVIRGLSFSVGRGEIFAIVGGNGTGKSTLLSLLSGSLKPYRGKIRTDGKTVAMLPQNPQLLFEEKTVELDLHETASGHGQNARSELERIAELTEISHLLSMHPYDLSGGEQQRAALAKVLLKQPEILLLDEPTKGLDAYFKETLAEILKKLVQDGMTVILVSHDIEFCARHTDRCAMFFQGNIVTQDSAKRFFQGNYFYTTAANRMARNQFPDAVTCEDVIERCKASR